MALIITQKLARNGWPQDEPAAFMDEALLVKTEGEIDDDQIVVEKGDPSCK